MNTQKRVSYLNGSMTANASSTMGGFSARVVKNGAYGFASGAEYIPESIENIVKAALDNAIFLDGREKLNKPAFKPENPVHRKDGLEREDNLPQKLFVEFAGELDAHINEKYPKLLSRFVTTNVLNMEKLLYTSDGIISHSYTPRCAVYIGMTAQGSDGSPIEIFEPIGSYGLFDDIFKNPSELFGDAEKLYTQLMQKCEGVYAEPGIKTVILDADLAGILAHEAVGHTVEADFVQSGSVGGPSFGKIVASELVTMTDYANTFHGEPCPVPVYVDDEGTVATDAVLIKDGVLVGYMHNKESAANLGHEPTGNARAYSFSDEPLIRMRNTCIVPGKDKLEDMIASIDDGYYFIKTGNGQADATGEFMFGVNYGYEVKNGKLGRALRDTTISGIAFEVLKTVDMLSDDLSWSCTGMCGKKQPIPVGMGGPAIRCKVNVGGR